MPLLTLDWLHVIALLGALQGFLLTGVLATKQANRTASRLLAAAMLAFSIFLASQVYYAVGMERVFPHFFGVSYPLPLVFGPLIYLYTRAASDRAWRFRARHVLHFVPLAAAVVSNLPVYLMSGEQKIEFYHQLLQGRVLPLLGVIDWLKYVSGVSYTVATIRFLRRHRTTVRDSYSSVERVSLNWLSWLTGVTALVWTLATSLQISELVSAPPRHGDDLVALGIAITVYLIGYIGLRQPEVFNYVTAEFPAVPPEAPPRYERSGLDDQEAMGLKDALLAVMEKERPYQKSDLTLSDLAVQLDTTPHKLSEVLSQKIGQTFYDFVNRYRVEDVQRRVADARSRNLTLLALALDAGFASKSTFNSVFKKHTGKTPSDYRRALAS